MKKIFATSLLLLSAAAFVACSNDDDDTPGPSVKYDVISFEPSTGMVDPSGETIALGNVTMSLYMNGAYVDHTYSNVFCGKPYAQGHNFDDMLFSTADGMASFLSYYSGDYDAWGGIALAACPDKGSVRLRSHSSSPCGPTAVRTARRPMPSATTRTPRPRPIPNT